MQKKIKGLPLLLLIFLSCFLTVSFASERDQELYQTALPYIKYFKDRALDSTPSYDGYVFTGLTRSFQINLGGHSPEDLRIINYGAAAYDQSILARICLAGGETTILDTYINYFHRLWDSLNPLLKTDDVYYDGSGQPIKHGPYRIVRILGREQPFWWSTWDWILDTGAAACLLIDNLEAYQKTSNADYKNFAILLGDYILRLKDADGGIRFGPRGMYHPLGNDFYWNLKSTEQNERCLYAFEALYQITAQAKYSQAISGLKDWLKSMYDKQVHLYYSASTFNVSTQKWEKRDFGYVATDVMAFAPLEMMFQDTFFGATQQERDREVDDFFLAIETRAAFFDAEGNPKLFRFSVSQTGDYGSVEWSAQMALQYLRAAQLYNQRAESVKTNYYLNRYNALVKNLDFYFFTPTSDPQARVAPYASYVNGRVAGLVPTGTGYFTYNCQAALASAYYAFAKAGYDPAKLGGGIGIPQTGLTLNMVGLPWYKNTTYNSTGAAVGQMILNYIRQGAGAPLLTQDAVYNYAKSPAAFGPDLTPDEIDKVLGHFDPYDSLVSNWADYYDSEPEGNPYQGYNFTVDTYDSGAPQAMNEYIRDICHWMAYTVTKEDWWRDGELVSRPNTPAAIPIFGDKQGYNYWVVVKGYAASANPTPEPHTNPFNTPDFTVYGFWIKDPLVNGIGKDTYKTAAECQNTYFKPLSTADKYFGKFVQVAEPPAEISRAEVKIQEPIADLANLAFVGIPTRVLNNSEPAVKKQGWQDIVDTRLLSDPQFLSAFAATKAGKPVLVKREDRPDADYYLVPFGKDYKKRNFLVTGVILLDASNGHFKEAAWTQIPEKFLAVDKNQAILLLKRYLRRSVKFTHYLDNVQTELFWQPGSLSASPYKPYWKINASGRIFYVTQEGKVIPQ